VLDFRLELKLTALVSEKSQQYERKGNQRESWNVNGKKEISNLNKLHGGKYDDDFTSSFSSFSFSFLFFASSSKNNRRQRDFKSKGEQKRIFLKKEERKEKRKTVKKIYFFFYLKKKRKERKVCSLNFDEIFERTRKGIGR